MGKFKHRVTAALSVLVLAVGLGAVSTGTAQAVPGLQNEPRPPAADSTWEKAAKSKTAQPWQFADKGYPGNSGRMKVAATDKKFKPRPGVVAVIPPAGLPVYRNYHVVKQTVGSPVDGLIADMTIADPYLNYASDYHGIMELAFQDGNGNVVEVGWTVNPTLCPSEPAGTAPCAFVYSWEGGVGQGYGVDFVADPGADYAPGDLLPNPNDSSGLNFRIVETTNEIWIGVGAIASPGYWMGYYPKTNWTAVGTDATAPFTQATLVQAFTETASTEAVSPTWNTSTPCSDSGNGYTATSPNGGTQAARIVNVKTTTSGGSVSTNATPTWLNDPGTIPAQAGGVFPMNTPAANNFRVGGTGWKGNNTLPGSRDICG
jgi:hypothetical protein